MKPEPASRAITEFLVRRRHWLIVVVGALTIFFGCLFPSMKPDTSMRSGVSTTSADFMEYLQFLEEYGNEEFILVAVKTQGGAETEPVIRALVESTADLEKVENVVEVLSLANLEVFRRKGSTYGSYPLLGVSDGEPWIVPEEELRNLRKVIPVLDMLVSEDLHTVGILVRMSEQSGYDPVLVGQVREEIRSILSRHVPPASDFRMIGTPIIRHAIHQYNIRTAAVFGILCVLISSLVSVYIFKSVRAAVITFIVIVISVIWVTGGMVLIGVRLNSVTSLSFGLVLIVSVAAVVHIVTHFNQRYSITGDRVTAAREALMIVARPCLMCSLTTATGFASIAVSSIPMVRELGIIMAVGVLLSYVIAIIITPSLLIMISPPPSSALRRMQRDWVAVAFNTLEDFVFRHYRLCAVLGLAVIAVNIAGVPFIRTDTQILRMLTESTPEMQDLRFIEENLAPVHSVEMVVSGGSPGAFKRAEPWKDVSNISQNLKTIDEVYRTESLLDLIDYLGNLVSKGESTPEALLDKPGMVPQLLSMMSLSPGGKRLLDRYMSDDGSEIRISIRILNPPGIPLRNTIGKILSEARAAAGGDISVRVTGALTVFEAQGNELVRAQTISLLLALTCITILMMVQFRSISLGLLSLIPNLFPLSIIFGLMGWFGLRLDNVTIFAATVSIGLSVDDTIHYLTQLRREVTQAKPGTTVADCLSGAYRTTAKALISTSAVLFFGFLMLLWSPFRPVVCFGILGSSAIVAALVADLAFMPAVILTVPFVRRLVEWEMPGKSKRG